MATLLVCNKKITLLWDDVALASQYTVRYTGTGRIPSETVGTVLAGVTSPLVVSGLANGEEYAFSPSFVNKKGDGIRWEDLPTVAAWTACSLAVIAGRTAGDAEGFADAVKAATDARPPLEKQQSRTQWGYIARTTFELLEAMSVDLEGLNRNLKQQFGFTCLRTLRDIDALNIRLA